MSELRKAVERATRRLIAPLAKFYLRSGLGFGDFEDAVKRAFVTAAIEEAHAHSQSPTQSRIATVTGFSRPEVRRLLQPREDASAPSHDRRARAARVLDGLWTDPDFLDEMRQPRALPLRGPVPSVVTAVKRYAGSERAAPILRELLTSKAMRRLENGQYKAVRRTCTNVPGDKASLALLAEDIGSHLNASVENLGSPEEERHFVSWAQSDDLDPDEANKVLFPRLRESGQILIGGANETLGHKRYKVRARKNGKKAVRIRVAIQITREDVGTAAGPSSGSKTGPRAARQRKKQPRRQGGSGEVGAD